jgi:diphthamide synthase (EF-2-diphthine--ammonia ligase)
VRTTNLVYTQVVSTVAERLRVESLERLRRMTPAERMAEAMTLGDRAIASYAAAHGLDADRARRCLERSGQGGRRLSRVTLDIIE